MSEKHTELPWKTHNGIIWGRCKGGCQLQVDDFMVAQIRGWGHLQYLGLETAEKIQVANAKYICLAANNHDLMIEAIEYALATHYPDNNLGVFMVPKPQTCQEILEAILAKIEKEKGNG